MPEYHVRFVILTAFAVGAAAFIIGALFGVSDRTADKGPINNIAALIWRGGTGAAAPKQPPQQKQQQQQEAGRGRAPTGKQNNAAGRGRAPTGKQNNAAGKAVRAVGKEKGAAVRAAGKGAGLTDISPSAAKAARAAQKTAANSDNIAAARPNAEQLKTERGRAGIAALPPRQKPAEAAAEIAAKGRGAPPASAAAKAGKGTAEGNLAGAEGRLRGILNGYKGYRHYRPGYKAGGDGWWYPRAAFPQNSGNIQSFMSLPRKTEKLVSAPQSPLMGGGKGGARRRGGGSASQSLQLSPASQVLRAHQNWCAAHYPYYDPADNSYGRIKGWRKQCASPYLPRNKAEQPRR